jgi:hypothetical protein
MVSTELIWKEIGEIQAILAHHSRSLESMMRRQEDILRLLDKIDLRSVYTPKPKSTNYLENAKAGLLWMAFILSAITAARGGDIGAILKLLLK